MDSIPRSKNPGHHSTGEYQIASIELENGRHEIVTLYRLDLPAHTEPSILHFNEPLKLRVRYECLLPEVPDVSCGVAAALTIRETMEAAMYFNTNYPHSDEEIKRYDEAEFRKYRGRKGVIEGYIHRLQVKPADYLLTVGLLPNSPTHHEFYELHYLQYPITVRSRVDFPAMFYPNVAFTNTAIGTPSISSAMVRAGQDVIARHVPLGVKLDERALTELYFAMKQASD